MNSKGKLIYSEPHTKYVILNIFSLTMGVIGILVIPLVWIFFERNLNPLSWCTLEWLIFISSLIPFMGAIIFLLATFTTKPLEIYDNGFYPSYIPVKFIFKKRIFIPWDDVVYMEYITWRDIGELSQKFKGFRVYYKFGDKIWMQQIGNRDGFHWMDKSMENRVLSKLYEVYTKLKNEGKLLPEKPKNVQMTI